MKLLRSISKLGVFIGILLISISSLLLFIENNPSPTVPIKENQISEANTSTNILVEDINTENTTPQKTLKESAWIPNWAFDIGFESLKNNSNIDIANPVLYTISEDGSVVNRGVSEEDIEDLVSYTRGSNIEVVPTIAAFNSDNIKKSLDSKSSENIYTLLSEIERFGFDGVDIDYEMIDLNDEEQYFIFLQNLSRELKTRNKILSVTVFPQWENASYIYHPDTVAVQNYQKIGEIADQIRIMTYDYTPQNSELAGPIAPINWVAKVIDYATKHIPKEKIWMGIHLYGYQWTPTQTIGLTYTTVEQTFSNSNINNVFLEEIGEGFAEFGCYEGERCTMYYQTKQGIQDRKNIAKEYGIAGVSYWKLGGELDILK